MRAAHRSLDDWLSDIEENAAKVVAYTSTLSYDAFLANEPVRDLVQKKLENMGEATRYLHQLHPEFPPTCPSIPWRELADTRNRLTHGYFDVSPAIVWRVAVNEVPPVLTEIRRIIADRGEPAGERE